MTKDELQLWIKESKLIDAYKEFDANGNCEEWRVYERDGKLFRLEFLNGKPYEKYDGKQFIRGEYELCKVIREIKTIEVVDYIEDGE